MAAINNGNVKFAKLVIPIVVAILLATTLGISKWTVTKTMDLDKELGMVKEVNKTEHTTFKKSFEEQKTEQRIILRKVEKIDRTLIKIATKLDVETP